VPLPRRHTPASGPLYRPVPLFRPATSLAMVAHDLMSASGAVMRGGEAVDTGGPCPLMSFLTRLRLMRATSSRPPADSDFDHSAYDTPQVHARYQLLRAPRLSHCSCLCRLRIRPPRALMEPDAGWPGPALPQRVQGRGWQAALPCEALPCAASRARRCASIAAGHGALARAPLCTLHRVRPRLTQHGGALC
jgi:hypothetical protein